MLAITHLGVYWNITEIAFINKNNNNTQILLLMKYKRFLIKYYADSND